MSETSLIVKTLKSLLRTKGITYMDIADRLHLSEASIKQMFSKNKLSLDRLDKICEMLGMEITDLVVEVNQQQSQLKNLTFEQEMEVVSDLKLLIVAVSVLTGFSFKEIVEKYKISEQTCRRMFNRLEKLNLIRLLPDDRYKLCVRRSFTWITNGPVQSYFHENLQKEFFDASFEKESEKLILASGVLSDTANSVMANKIEKLATEFGQLNDEDKNLPMKEKTGFTLVVGFRQWRPDSFKQLMRHE